jgi:hypothetical protein
MEIVTRIVTKILNMDCTPAKREFCGQERPRSRSPLLAGPLRPVTSPCPAATDDRSCDRHLAILDQVDRRGFPKASKSAIDCPSTPAAPWLAFTFLKGIVNLTRSSRPSWPLSLERGQPYRGAKDFSAPNRRAADGRRIPPLLKLTMPLSVSNPLRRPGPVALLTDRNPPAS